MTIGCSAVKDQTENATLQTVKSKRIFYVSRGGDVRFPGRKCLFSWRRTYGSAWRNVVHKGSVSV